MASGMLTFALEFVLLAGVVSGFGRYRTVDYFLDRLQARRQPPAGPPPPPKGRMFAQDPVFLKYALGFTDPTIDPNLFDFPIASEAYFNLFKVTGDPKLIASQFARTDILQHLLDINKCFSTKAMRLVVVGIASDLQDAIERKMSELEPELEKILPELPAGDRDINKATKILTILLIKSTVFSFLPKMADLGYLKDFGRTVEENLIRNANNRVDDFVRDMVDFKTANPPPTCKPLEEVSRILKDFIQKLPDSFPAEILPIIAKLRKAMNLHGLGQGTLSVKDLLDTLEPEILDLTDEYKPVGSTDGLERFLDSVGIPLPADPTSRIDPSNPLNKKFREVSRKWIGDDGPLRGFINHLKNPGYEADGDDY